MLSHNNPGMNSREFRTLCCTVSLVLASLLIAGCSHTRGWAQGGGGQTSRAGASITLPLGK